MAQTIRITIRYHHIDQNVEVVKETMVNPHLHLMYLYNEFPSFQAAPGIRLYKNGFTLIPIERTLTELGIRAGDEIEVRYFIRLYFRDRPSARASSLIGCRRTKTSDSRRSDLWNTFDPDGLTNFLQSHISTFRAWAGLIITTRSGISWGFSTMIVSTLRTGGLIMNACPTINGLTRMYFERPQSHANKSLLRIMPARFLSSTIATGRTESF